MINGQMVLAVIPARGGSKRCPRKNLREFSGKPLIQLAWEKARDSRYIDIVILSTEDAEIREFAKHHVTVIRRPDRLATDAATNEDVMRHALTLIESEWIVLLQPSSPLRWAHDIDACIEIAQPSRHDDITTCISVRQSDGSKNGAVYVARSQWLLEGHNFDEPYRPYRMPDTRSLDIDFPEQFGDDNEALKAAELIEGDRRILRSLAHG